MTEQIKVGVGVLFLSVDSDRVLLNLRAPHKTHSLCWSLWGGMCNSGEQPIDALARELHEEMGFIPDIEKLYPFDAYQSTDNHFRFYSFVAVVSREFIPIINSESAGYAWINLGQWPKHMHRETGLSFCNSHSLRKMKMIISQHRGQTTGNHATSVTETPLPEDSAG